MVSGDPEGGNDVALMWAILAPGSLPRMGGPVVDGAAFEVVMVTSDYDNAGLRDAVPEPRVLLASM